MIQISKREAKYKIRDAADFIVRKLCMIYCFTDLPEANDVCVERVLCTNDILYATDIVENMLIHRPCSQRFIFRHTWKHIKPKLPYIICDVVKEESLKQCKAPEVKCTTNSLYDVIRNYFSWMCYLLSRQNHLSYKSITAEIAVLQSQII